MLKPIPSVNVQKTKKIIYPLMIIAVSVLVLVTGASLIASVRLESDDRIKSLAINSYVFKTYLRDDDIKVESKRGEVTLSGTVAEDTHRLLAQDTVESLFGVTRVNNQLTVKSEVPAEFSDSWLGLKVKTALLFHRNVNASKTEVNVKDGVVTLKGEANSMAQKELTTEYAKDIDNVKEVRNEMTIVETPAETVQSIKQSIDDASITAQIKSSLMMHRSTSALNTKVRTINGDVTILGFARNAAEKSLVTKLVNDIHGVNSVINNMNIDAKTASSK